MGIDHGFLQTSSHPHPQPSIRSQRPLQRRQCLFQPGQRQLFLLAPQLITQPLLHHLYRCAALDHHFPEFGGGAYGKSFGDFAYLDVAKPRLFHFLLEAFGVFQCGDGALRLRQLGLDGAQCAEHGHHRGRLVHGRPAGDGDAATRLECAVDFGETLLAIRKEHEAKQRKGSVKGVIRIGQGLRIAAVQRDVAVPGLLDLVAEHGEHGFGEVDAVHLFGLVREPERQGAGAAGDIEYGGVGFEFAGGDSFVGELFENEHGGLGIAVGNEVPGFASGKRVLACGGLERRLIAGCVRQVFPFSLCADCPLCGFLSCASSFSGDCAFSLAPCVRCDVLWADLQVPEL